MKHNHQSSINTAALAVLLLISLGTAAEDFYRQGEASRDGIGKFYMGREISEVMGHMGAGWLERPERERQERTDLLLQSMEPVSYTHLTLPTRCHRCRSRWSPDH